MSQPIPSEAGDAGKIRLFTALAFAPSVKESLEELLRKLKTGSVFTGAHPSWVKSEGLHATLVFLGWQGADSVDSIKRAMEEAASRCSPFRMVVGGVELFPTPKNPRVIAVNLGGDTEALVNLQHELSVGCAGQGFGVEDREYRPHVTLARIKSMRGLSGLRDVVRGHRSFSAGSFVVDRITLYQSILKPDGAEYTVLHEAMLSAV